MKSKRKLLVIFHTILVIVLTGCEMSVDSGDPYQPVAAQTQAAATNPTVPTVFSLSTRRPNSPIYTPTPDPIRKLPTPRTSPDRYTVQPGDTLGKIAQRFNVDVNLLIETNKLTNPDRLQVGQVLVIPAPTPAAPAPAFKIIPDSELINSPSNSNFDLHEFVQSQKGYLAGFHEDIDGISHSGADVVGRIAREYSVNPRLLLAVIEYQSKWVTQSSPPAGRMEYPLGIVDPRRKTLYSQLAWTASQLNLGFYLWRVNAVSAWTTTDGLIIPASPTINAGTAGVQNLFSELYDRSGWEKAISDKGIFQTYQALFGYPFDYSFDPLRPTNLKQPNLILPFEKGEVWSFTGGPHAGWGAGSAWAGLDFAPPGKALGCVKSDSWVTAMANGMIIRVENGAVIQDLDGDGIEQTGWTLLYMHIETRDRVAVGTYLKAGERIGHPSCEGGVSNGTHTHLARRYNGEWISADDPSLPFNLEGWIASSDGQEYDGKLMKDGKVVEAWDGRRSENQIQR